MFGYFSKQLTKASSHYIDWSRIGELAASNSHQYSRDELLTRAGMITATGVLGYLAAAFNDEEKTGCTNMTMSLIGAGLGFVASHAVVIYPLVKKRLEMSESCKVLSREILSKFKDSDQYTEENEEKLSGLIQEILSQSCADEAHSRASQTWGYRRRLMNNLNELLNGSQLGDDFFGRSSEAMLTQVKTGLNSSSTNQLN